MISWINKWMESYAAKYIGSTIRHGLTLLAGVLAAEWARKAGVTPEMVTEFTEASTPLLIAIATYAFSQLWSFAQKNKGK